MKYLAGDFSLDPVLADELEKKWISHDFQEGRSVMGTPIQHQRKPQNPQLTRARNVLEPDIGRLSLGQDQHESVTKFDAIRKNLIDTSARFEMSSLNATEFDGSEQQGGEGKNKDKYKRTENI